MTTNQPSEKTGAYYNEIDPFAAQWLRELIKAGHIAHGYVDESSIEDVKPSDLKGYTQCHFFAGVGVWSYALRQAGWPDDRPVWTGSCPCQPFSAAGKGSGFDDERHLWPSFYWLIEQCKPAIVLGEQVASKAAEPWIDLVQADVESLGYAFGCIPFPSAGVGAPHLRDRAYWVADSNSDRCESRDQIRLHVQEHDTEHGSSESWLADTSSVRCGSGCESAEIQEGREARSNAGGELENRSQGCTLHSDECSPIQRDGSQLEASPTNGFWSDADWLGCRDGKWRPVEPGTFPLAAGIANRVGKLRGYGNAINAQAAQAFIESVMETV